MRDTVKIKIWDPVVRIFHWVLVASFAIAYLTEEDFLTIHIWAGYIIFGLLVIRIICGFIGTKYARFSDFVYRLKTIIQFLNDTAIFKAR